MANNSFPISYLVVWLTMTKSEQSSYAEARKADKGTGGRLWRNAKQSGAVVWSATMRLRHELAVLLTTAHLLYKGPCKQIRILPTLIAKLNKIRVALYFSTDPDQLHPSATESPRGRTWTP